jgi:hypothetical protein
MVRTIPQAGEIRPDAQFVPISEKRHLLRARFRCHFTRFVNDPVLAKAQLAAGKPLAVDSGPSARRNRRA